MSNMTEAEAIAKAETKWWETCTPEEIVQFQLYEDRMCMPFGDFHEAVESALGRSVWTHEFANPERLREEFEGKRGTATPAEIFGELESYGKPVIYLTTKGDEE